MKVSSDWIKEHLGRTILTDQEVVEALERAGIEIEQIIESIDIDDKVVIALIKKVVQHPNADKLHLVTVATGDEEFSIVCGANNLREGMKVALAQIGAVLPGGERIGKAKLRGEVSEGMLCSSRELKLGHDHDGILELPDTAKVGDRVSDLYSADTVIDLKTPANRFDLQSVVGLAREVAAMSSADLLPLAAPELESPSSGAEVKIDATVVRYMLVHASVDQSSTPPAFIAKRLVSSGMRSVSPVVDVTNYAMLEFGQPLHAFDVTKVSLPIEVRHGRSGETLTTLDGVTRKLTNKDLIIADQSGPLALAGVMGGSRAEVSSDTKEILLESAVFDGTVVRKMAKRHGLRTEASARFERGLPIQLPPIGASRAMALLNEVAGGKLISVSDHNSGKVHPERIAISASRFSTFLGFSITRNEIADALAALQIVPEPPKQGKEDEDSLVVEEVPWWRPDVKLPEDLAEEVVRVIGYDKVPSTIPAYRPVTLEFDRIRSKRRRVRDLMFAAGLFEVMTYSFVSAEQLQQFGLDLSAHLKLKNPLSSEQAYLRSGLLPSHLAVVARNRNYGKEFGLYEISSVFVKKAKGEQPDEPVLLGVTVRRPDAAFAVVKGILDALTAALNIVVRVEPNDSSVYAPGRGGQVLLEGDPVGSIGQIHPKLTAALKSEGETAYLELDLGRLLEAGSFRQFSRLDRYPTIHRDVTVLVPQDVTWQMVSDAIAKYDAKYVDVYYGAELPEGFRGLTLRIVASHPDRTPTEAEAADLERTVIGLLERKVGAKSRV